MTPERFRDIYSDADLRDFVADMARRLAPTREAAEDAEQEAWFAIGQAPDHVSMASLRSAIVASMASSVHQERKPYRAWKRWVSVLKHYL